MTDVEKKISERNALNTLLESDSNSEQRYERDTELENIISEFALLEDRLGIEEEQEIEGKEPEPLKYLLKSNIGNIVVGIGYLLMVLHCVSILITFSASIRDINLYFSRNYIPLFFIAFMPFLLWLFSTTRWAPFWNYFIQKFTGFCITIIHIGFCAVPVLYNSCFIALVPLIMKLPTNRDITPGMILNLCRGAVAVPTIALPIIVIASVLKHFTEKEAYLNLASTKIDRHWDLRKNKKNLYDVHFMRRLDDGTVVRQEMDARLLHSVYIGATGSGKTSTCVSRSIVDDLQQKADNMDSLMKIANKLTKEGAIAPIKPFTTDEFTPEFFKVINQERADEWKRAIDKFPNCGITAVAPNAAFADDIYRYARLKGFKVNRVDPTLTENDMHKPGYVGFNPLFISPGKSDFQKEQEIIKKARIFADVLESLNEMKGAGDPYFTSLNHMLTSTITKVVMKAYPMLNHGEQPNLRHVQEVFGDFTKAQRYYEVLENADEEIKARYAVELSFIRNRLLEPKSRQKLVEHATGLTVMVNNFLGQELIANVLCAKNSIDLDKTLSEGQITVVNFALELSQEDAAVFGNFYILNFIAAVFRRPKSPRIPHFFYCDEWPVLVNKNHKQMFSLFRQYKVGVGVALQSLDQIDIPQLEGMKNLVLSSAGLIVIFGRASESEMETFSKMAGTAWSDLEQKTVSEKSITDENADMSFSTRITRQRGNAVEGDEFRFQDFKNAYVFMVEQGTPLPPFRVKTDFLNDMDIKKLKRYDCDWNALYQEYGIHTSKAPERLPEEGLSESSESKDNANNLPVDANGVIVTNKIAMGSTTLSASNNADDNVKANGSLTVTLNDTGNAGKSESIDDATGLPNGEASDENLTENSSGEISEAVSAQDMLQQLLKL